MTEKMMTLLEKGDYKIPYTLFINYKRLSLSELELIFLIYFINEDKVFNPNKIKEELGLSLEEVMNVVDALVSKDMIELKVSKTKGDYISLDHLYKKLAYFLSNKEVKTKKSNIYDMFEKEFSRTLSPMDYEIITSWLNAGHKEDMIALALKEAVYNGALNLRYVDKILFEWKKKGIDTKDKYEKNKTDFKERPKKELLDYDWLDDK